MKNINKTTILTALELFLNYLYSNQYSKNTLISYRTDIRFFNKFITKHHPCLRYTDQLTKLDISEYKCHLRKLVETNEISYQTQDRRVFSLISFHNFLLDNNMISGNLLGNIKYKKQNKKDIPDCLTKEEMDLILESIKNSNRQDKKRQYAIWCLLRYTGCRRSEVLDLTWSNISFYNNTIGLWRRKTNNYSVLPMHPTLQQALMDLYSVSNIKKSPYAFVSRQSGQLSPTAFTNSLAQDIKNSELNKDFSITSKTFRTSFVTHLSKNNIPDAKIKYFTGHYENSAFSSYISFKPQDLADVLQVL